MIPLNECKNGFLYKLDSRNLIKGVFREDIKGFIGIRMKFDSLYLDTEFHWDTGPPHGTAKPIKEIGPIPSGILISENSKIIDSISKRTVSWVKEKGWFFIDDGVFSEKIRPSSIKNQELFDFLSKGF